MAWLDVYFAFVFGFALYFPCFHSLLLSVAQGMEYIKMVFETWCGNNDPPSFFSKDMAETIGKTLIKDSTKKTLEGVCPPRPSPSPLRPTLSKRPPRQEKHAKSYGC